MSEHETVKPQFYLTAPQPCPYLDGHFERKVFTHLSGPFACDIGNLLNQGGFRRSQNIAYRPVCENCQACISVRVCVASFSADKSMKRIEKRNHNILSNQCLPLANPEQYILFQDYQDHRHPNGGMADMTMKDYQMMIEDTHVDTMVIEYRNDDMGAANDCMSSSLVGVALTDVISDGLSMVYSFYRPSLSQRSLGTYMILDHIKRARDMGLPYLYLGYWVEGSHKMNYKQRFRPQERLINDRWQYIE